MEALAGVSVINRSEIKAQAPQRIGTTISQMPGVTTQENPNDPATAINIRGLQDFGRVAVTVDGARQNFQTSGHNADGTFYLDPAFIRTIDVTRGPVANVYGSGAIGGVASFETLEPKDVLRPGERLATELGFTSAFARSEGIYGHGIGAFRANDWASGLLGLSFRNIKPYKDGGGRTVADTDFELLSGLGKLVLTPGEGHTLKLSGQMQNYQFANGAGTLYSPRRESDVKTSNFVARYSFSRPDNDWLDLNLSAYRTTTEMRQTRVSGKPAQIGQWRNFNIMTTGADINNTNRFELGGVKMAVTYGIDGFQDHVRSRDDFAGGAGFTPPGQRSVYGGFVQNHARWQKFDLITALRYDGYLLSRGEIQGKGQRVSPKLTLGYALFDGVQPYVTYAEGYRAPAITETLIQGVHPGGVNFAFVPNPHLKPETGRTLEAGLNLKFNNLLVAGDGFRGKFSLFENRVADYIDGVMNDPGNDCGRVRGGCADASYGYRNVGRARLRGVEGEVSYDARRWFASLGGSAVRGDNLSEREPLESVYPHKFVLGGGLRFLDEKLVLGGRATFVAAQKRLPAAMVAGNGSRAYTLLDANLAYELPSGSRFFVRAENLGDVRYKRYRDGDSSPGLTVKVGLVGRFGI